MSFSNDLEIKVLDHVFGGSAYTKPGTLHLALCTAAPSDTSTGSTLTEATYTGYARKAITNDATIWSAASAGQKRNAVEIQFAECTGGSSTVTHFAIVDAATGGNVLCYGTLTTSRAISAGITPRFKANDIVINLD